MLKSERVYGVSVLQVLEKYGDIYGRERIAELLGMDLASLDVSAMTHEKKTQPDPSMFTWYRKMHDALKKSPKFQYPTQVTRNDSLAQQK